MSIWGCFEQESFLSHRHLGKYSVKCDSISKHVLLLHDLDMFLTKILFATCDMVKYSIQLYLCLSLLIGSTRNLFFCVKT